MRKLKSTIDQQWAGLLALFLVLSGGTAWAADTVFSEDIVDGQVMSQDIAAAAIDTGHVADESLEGIDILDESITGQDVQALTQNDINGKIDGSRIDDITGKSITDGSLDTLDISFITGNDVLDYSLDGFDVQTGGLFGSNIHDGSLDDRDVQNGGLTGEDIANNSLNTVDVHDLTGEDIIDGALGGEEIGPDRLSGDDVDESSLDFSSVCKLPFMRAMVEVKGDGNWPNHATSNPRFVRQIYSCSGQPVTVKRLGTGAYSVKVPGPRTQVAFTEPIGGHGLSDHDNFSTTMWFPDGYLVYTYDDDGDEENSWFTFMAF